MCKREKTQTIWFAFTVDVTHYCECRCDLLDRGYTRKLRKKKVIFNNNRASKHVLLKNLESHIKNTDEEEKGTSF